VNDLFKGKRILIIGGTGTVGRGLFYYLLTKKPEVIRLFSRDEHKQFLLENELGVIKSADNGEEIPATNNTRFLIGDVRDKERVIRAMEGIDIVFNVAAMKHVPSCEYNPFEAVKTNVLGVQNVIEAALKNNVKTVVYTSTDKAASPTNTMGATKLLAERLMSAAQFSRGTAQTKFVSVRFGNILMSRGSVLPLFVDQAKKKSALTLTEPEMTRFVMTIEKAVELIIKATEISLGGEIFVLKMPVVKMEDVGKAVMEYFDHSSLDVIGKRPGEKMYEELMSEEESLRALELEDMFAVLPFFGDREKYETYYGEKAKPAKEGIYSSRNEDIMDYSSVKKLIFDILNKEGMI
jgi:FlaA1/EpsC-like NDP-sugar epimerase